MEKLDYKKKFKELYQPKSVPSVVDVPQMQFIAIDGKGNPNDENGEYQAAVETLYALSYGIKMMPKSGNTPHDYFEYVVPPLEGLWWLADSGEQVLGLQPQKCRPACKKPPCTDFNC